MTKTILFFICTLFTTHPIAASLKENINSQNNEQTMDRLYDLLLQKDALNNTYTKITTQNKEKIVFSPLLILFNLTLSSMLAGPALTINYLKKYAPVQFQNAINNISLGVAGLAVFPGLFSITRHTINVAYDTFRYEHRLQQMKNEETTLEKKINELDIIIAYIKASNPEILTHHFLTNNQEQSYQNLIKLYTIKPSINNNELRSFIIDKLHYEINDMVNVLRQKKANLIIETYKLEKDRSDANYLSKLEWHELGMALGATIFLSPLILLYALVTTSAQDKKNKENHTEIIAINHLIQMLTAVKEN